MPTVTAGPCCCGGEPTSCAPISCSIPFTYEPLDNTGSSPNFGPPFQGYMTGSPYIVYRIYYGTWQDAPYEDVSVPVSDANLEQNSGVGGNILYFAIGGRDANAITFDHGGYRFVDGGVNVTSTTLPNGPGVDIYTGVVTDSTVFDTIARNGGVSVAPIPANE